MKEKTKGRKRHIITDIMGNFLCINVHVANIHDTKGGVFTFEKALFYYPSIEGVCANSAYKKHFRNIFEEFHNLKVNISERLTSTFTVMPKRWKVKHTSSWLCHSRCLSKDYEIRTIYAETIVIISHLYTLLCRF